MNKTPIIAIALLLGCLAGCNDATEQADVADPAPPAPAKTTSLPKPAASRPPVPQKIFPEQQESDAEYFEDASPMSPPPPAITDMEAEQYDYDADMPPPEDNNPMLDLPEDGNDDEGMEEMDAEQAPERPAPK